MSNILVIPERNEGQAPLHVVEQSLTAARVDEILIVDGWSTDDTWSTLEAHIPALEERYGKPIDLIRADLRGAGKGAAMVSGIKQSLARGHERILFLDADITSVTSEWCDHLVEGMDAHDVDMTRGYFDRSPYDAQITRHVTRPLISMFFPEGRSINQPLGGELCMSADLARSYLENPIAPPSTWGIDTHFTISALMAGYRIAELYLTQKTHNKKDMDQLRGMFLECFDEAAKQIHFHGRDRAIPAPSEPLVVVAPRSASSIQRVGEDVRTQVYLDLDEQIESFQGSIGRLKEMRSQLGDLGYSAESKNLLLDLLGAGSDFREMSAKLGPKDWIPILAQLVRGYIARGFSASYHDLLFVIWELRSLSFSLHEARDFETAESATSEQAALAFQFGQRMQA